MTHCTIAGGNHSGDIVKVFHGCLTPYVLCGYHASRSMTPETHSHNFVKVA